MVLSRRIRYNTDLVNVNSLRFSADGRRLVVGARSYGADPNDLGGALLIYERAGNGWQLIYEKTTGGDNMDLSLTLLLMPQDSSSPLRSESQE
jgi:hypothetical protein